jgi:hypothetical protein
LRLSNYVYLDGGMQDKVQTMNKPRFRIVGVLPYIWLLVMAATVVISAQSAYRKSLTTEEFAHKCDQFGYLRMAKEIRQAASELNLPEFKLESRQTRLLINFMQSQNVPVPLWDEVVAPHAHHYFPKSNSVGVQYPPGTGLTLALFPEGKAVYSLNRTVVIFFVLAGFVALGIAAWKAAWASAGLVTLAIHLGLAILGRMGDLSFSINAVFIPLLMSCLLALVTLGFKATNRNRLAFLSAFAAGLFLGFATLIRLPCIFLAPGFLILLWPNTWRIGIKSLPVLFGLGVVLTGILPVLFHQQVIAGAWFLPTYASVDAALPTFERVSHNLSYFFGDGPAAQDNWALLYAFIGFSGFVIATRPGHGSQIGKRFGLSWRRVFFAALVMWLLPTIFFLTHWVVGPHYAIPATFGALVLIGFGSLAIEATSGPVVRQGRNALWWLALVFLLAPGLAALKHAWSEQSPNPAPDQPIAHAQIVLPAELADERAWIWADFLTGTLWYYANKPAYKIQFTNPETRAMIFRFVFERGESQYLIRDSESMQTYMDEISRLGGRLEQKGKVDGQPYFLVAWPTEGPRVTAVAINAE